MKCGAAWIGGDLWFGGEFLGQRVVGALFVPENVDDPPALAVVDHLDAVNAAGEGRFAEGVAGFVAAENLRDGAEGLDVIDDGLFEEAIFQEVAAAEADVVLDAVGADVDGAVGRFSGGSQAGVGHK